MTKKSGMKTSKAKLSNKAANKKQKSKRKHKLENRPSSSGKEVYLPSASLKKLSERKQKNKMAGKKSEKEVVHEKAINGHVDDGDAELVEDIELDDELSEIRNII